uniref:Ovule protein n=1 Tax=Ascaris lumbricoides TaxID=6252 RepID=A0A0M3IJC8_ASCLU
MKVYQEEEEEFSFAKVFHSQHNRSSSITSCLIFSHSCRLGGSEVPEIRRV